jgi:Ribosomal protein L7/L12 C-terminal domain
MTLRIPPDAAAAAARGELIEAIKRTREATGLGLKEAKELVDRHVQAQATGWHDAHGDEGGGGDHTRGAHPGAAHGRQSTSALTARRPGLAPGEVPRSRLPLGLVAAVIAGILAVYLFIR